MNERIGAIPRYPGLKIFSKGLQSIARLTASEHRDLMKVMIFVVDGLLSNDLSEVYVKWNEMYILNRLEIFKESDLEKFQKAINDWANLFVILFRKKSDSKMKFPKFHSWIFHIVDTIQEYGAINKYTTETYESLHKSYVKTPYRLSNKKDIEEQIMKTQRVTEKLYKTPTTLIYTLKLFEFKLLKASIFFEQQKKNLDLTKNMIKGFAKFLECLDLFFDMLDIISAENCQIKIFAIAMDDAELFKYQSDNGTYIIDNGIEIYNFIKIEAIEEIVHIVPRFDTKDEYFNMFFAVKSSGGTRGVVRWAEILGVIVLSLDASRAHGGSRSNSESASIEQRFGRRQLPIKDMGAGNRGRWSNLYIQCLKTTIAEIFSGHSRFVKLKKSEVSTSATAESTRPASRTTSRQASRTTSKQALPQP
ncbi:hypothetical protein Glove_121g46 [Diversispora epigaea]|uniref:Uncharacterized protein n=1 Tax=Diversispora epigaea TaxID=1348612 RepID=A0A397J802_9GLOM|nr:hypothetical protein Glove_121g46 [Diversispora epigaea]